MKLNRWGAVFAAVMASWLWAGPVAAQAPVFICNYLTNAAGAPNCVYANFGDSGPVSVSVPVVGTHSTGSSVGGLIAIPFGQYPGNGGIITNFLWKSINGDATAKVGRLWSAKPVNTTCTDGTAFAGSDTDDAYLIGPGPFSFTPAAPATATGDSSTYASVTGVTWDFRNGDSVQSGGNGIPTSQNVYLCVIAGASDTVDVGHNVRVILSGPRS